MKVAILGWGSLIWNPKDLATEGDWQPDGPYLPIEFARISGKNEDRLTLVCMEGVQPIRTYWIKSSKARLDEARENLRVREGKGLDLTDMGYITHDECSWFVPFCQIGEPLREWLALKKELDAVIWTGLASNFLERTRKNFSVDQGIAWLRELVNQRKHAKAEEYIRKAPPQTNTRLREQCRVSLGWTDLDVCEKC
jgi:hypothetical protein